MAVTIPRILGVLTSLIDPNKITSIGKFNMQSEQNIYLYNLKMSSTLHFSALFIYIRINMIASKEYVVWKFFFIWDPEF